MLLHSFFLASLLLVITSPVQAQPESSRVLERSRDRSDILDIPEFRNGKPFTLNTRILAPVAPNPETELQEARESIEFARQRVDRIDSSPTALMSLESARDRLLRSGQTLESAGTSETEINDLLRRATASTANYWLNAARADAGRSGTNTERWIQIFRDYAARAGRSLSDYGVSESALTELNRRGYGAAARYWLQAARDSVSRDGLSFNSFLRNFRDYQARSGEPLSSFGIDANGLLALEQEGNIVSARYWINASRDRGEDRDRYLRLALNYILASIAPISTYNLTAAEIERIRRLPGGTGILESRQHLTADEVNPNFIVDLSCVQSTMRLRGIHISPKYLVLQGFYAVRGLRQNQNLNITQTVVDSIFQNGYCSIDTYGGIPATQRESLLRVLRQPTLASNNEQISFQRFFGVNPRVVTSLGQISSGAIQASDAMDRSNIVRGYPISGFSDCHREMKSTQNNNELRAALISGCNLSAQTTDAPQTPPAAVRRAD
jgi:hypothetical protein